MGPDLLNRELLCHIVGKDSDHCPLNRLRSMGIKEIILAQEAERLRIARELHDCTIQSLIALLHQFERLKNRKKSSNLTQIHMDFSKQLKQIIKEVRSLAYNLRPVILEHCGLILSFEYYLKELAEEYGIQVECLFSGTKYRFLPEVEIGIFRVFQEALNNIARHAQASKVNVSCEFKSIEAVLMIKDNGIGFEGLPNDFDELTSQGKLGLAGMFERVKLFSGRLDLQSYPGQGTIITVILPVADNIIT